MIAMFLKSGKSGMIDGKTRIGQDLKADVVVPFRATEVHELAELLAHLLYRRGIEKFVKGPQTLRKSSNRDAQIVCGVWILGMFGGALDLTRDPLQTHPGLGERKFR